MNLTDDAQQRCLWSSQEAAHLKVGLLTLIHQDHLQSEERWNKGDAH